MAGLRRPARTIDGFFKRPPRTNRNHWWTSGGDGGGWSVIARTRHERVARGRDARRWRVARLDCCGRGTRLPGRPWCVPDGVLTGAAASATSSTAQLDEQVPVRGVSAPIGAASARRRGGRAPRPPPLAPIASPASEHIDLSDDKNEADWCDENLRIVCEIFADEVQKGNRSNTHLNKTWYKNVIASFKQRTGLDYTRLQFKNRWDKLKADYVIWKQLKHHETSIGWDETKKNIVMSEAWWKKTSKDIKGCTRFKIRGLQNEDKLEIMFEDIRNTGDDHWSASSGILPSSANLSRESSPFHGDDEEEAENDDDSDPEDVTPTNSRVRKGRGAGNDKGKKPKTSTGHWFNNK